MTIACSVLVLLICVFAYLAPVSTRYLVRAHRQREEQFRLFQLRAIREYYDALRDVPLEELNRSYDVADWYQHIGRAPRK